MYFTLSSLGPSHPQSCASWAYLFVQALLHIFSPRGMSTLSCILDTSDVFMRHMIDPCLVCSWDTSYVKSGHKTQQGLLFCPPFYLPFLVHSPTISPLISKSRWRSKKCFEGSATGFHPVWDISYQKPCFLVQILWLFRFEKVPMFNIRPAGTNLWIRPIVLQENDNTSFFPRTRAWISNATTKSSCPKITSILLSSVIKFLPSGTPPISVEW